MAPLVLVFSKPSLWLGPLFSMLSFVLVQYLGVPLPASQVVGVTVLCAIWWIFEPVPIPVASLLPLSLFPLLGILTPNQVAGAYGSPLILLLLGGFILSTAMERSGAHRHIALLLVRLFGGNSSKRVVFGFMLASALLSMWVSNTATTLMLLPVALAILQNSNDDKLAIPLLLGICYSASIGGIGTPIGTPPNLVFMRVYEEAQGHSIGFLEWMSWAVPVVVLFVPIAALWLTRNLTSVGAICLPEKEAWSKEQKRVLIVFALTALTWMTRTEPFGGWRELLGFPQANDASVALLAVICMFIVPNGKGGKLLDWKTANKIPWGMLLLFAGGIALAKAFLASGLADLLALQLAGLANIPTLLMVLLVCLCVTFLTEVTSNTATTSLLMPVLASAAVAAKIDPLLLMVPAAMSASCAFMLPVATAPNAIVFGSEQVPIGVMAKQGLVLNFVGAILITLLIVNLL